MAREIDFIGQDAAGGRFDWTGTINPSPERRLLRQVGKARRVVQANMSPGGGRSQNAAVHVLFCACFSSSRTRSTVFMWPRARFDGNQLLIVDSVFGENLVGLDFL